MRHFFAFLLVCCFLGQASIRTLLVVHYQLDRAVYLQKCENRDKPNLHCDGKCYLKKQMGVEKTDNTKEPVFPESMRQIKDLQLFCEPFVLPSLIRARAGDSAALPPFQFSLPFAALAGVFRPPSVI